MWLATLAFSENISMVVLKTLVSLYIALIKHSLDSLANKLFVLKEGDNMNEEEIQSLIFSAALQQTPESNLHPMPHKTYSAFKSHKKAIKVTNRDTALERFDSPAQAVASSRTLTTIFLGISEIARLLQHPAGYGPGVQEVLYLV